MVNKNVVPVPFSLWTSILILFNSQYFFTNAKPSPFPSKLREYPCSSCENEVKSFGRYSFDMPIPLSLTETKIFYAEPFFEISTLTNPLFVNLIALSIKWSKIFMSEYSSQCTVSSSTCFSILNSIFFVSASDLYSA